MDRRGLLVSGAALAAVALTGCTGIGNPAGGAKVPTAALRMTPVTDTEIAERVTYGEDFEGGGRRRQLVAAAITTDATTVNGTEPPFPANKPFVYEDAVYELSYEVVETQPATSFQITLNPVDDEVDESETIAYEDLPAVDTETFERRGWDDIGFLGFGTSVLYLDEVIPASVLVPEPEYSVIVWDSDTRGRFTVDSSYDTDLKTYEYSATQVHESAAAFGQTIREQYEFSPSKLSTDEADIVAEAITAEHGSVVPAEEAMPEAMQRLADRFRPVDDVERVYVEDSEDEPTVSGTYLVRYKGGVYWTRLTVNPQSSPSTERA